MGNELSKHGKDNAGAVIGIGWKATQNQSREGMGWQNDGSARGFESLEE